MDPQEQSSSVLAPLKEVTPVSKYLAMALFIMLPLGGIWLGSQLAPVQYVEVAREVAAPAAAEAAPEEMVSEGYTASDFALATRDARDGKSWDEIVAQENIEDLSLLVTETVVVTPKGEDVVFSTEFYPCAPGSLSENVLENRAELEAFVTEESQLLGYVDCWSGGAGSELYLYDDGFTVGVVQLATQVCGEATRGECTMVYDVDSLARFDVDNGARH